MTTRVPRDGDELLAFARERPRSSALERARAGALAELRQAPVARSWRRRAVLVVAGVVGVTAVGAAFVAFAGGVAAELATARVPGIALLAVAQVAGLWAMLAPGRPVARVVAPLAAVCGAAAVLLARGPTAAAELPGWICSASHVATALVPLAVIAVGVRDSAWSLRRAWMGGLALGAAGPIWGEIACERGWEHVVLHHGGSWLVIAAATVVVARFVPRRSFAP